MEYKQKILLQWEEVYKKGQLTFWILLSLSDQPRYIEDIKAFIEQASEGSMVSQDQSLYRALRKFNEIDLVEYKEQDGNRGPKRKYYSLTPLGRDLLVQFAKRNIKPLLHVSILELLKEEA